jgi:hypothetical protein
MPGRLFAIAGLFVTFAGQQSGQLVLANAHSSSASASSSGDSRRSPAATHDNFTNVAGRFSQPSG